jgi:hypothetical protein
MFELAGGTPDFGKYKISRQRATDESLELLGNILDIAVGRQMPFCMFDNKRAEEILRHYGQTCFDGRLLEDRGMLADINVLQYILVGGSELKPPVTVVGSTGYAIQSAIWGYQ